MLRHFSHYPASPPHLFHSPTSIKMQYPRSWFDERPLRGHSDLGSLIIYSRGPRWKIEERLNEDTHQSKGQLPSYAARNSALHQNPKLKHFYGFISRFHTSAQNSKIPLFAPHKLGLWSLLSSTRIALLLWPRATFRSALPLIYSIPWDMQVVSWCVPSPTC